MKYLRTCSGPIVFSLMFSSCLPGISNPARAANWLAIQGLESPTSKTRFWGFLQPQYQYTDGTPLAAGLWQSQPAQFNQVGPDLNDNEMLQLRRARIGARGNLYRDPHVNFFILSEFGRNGITRPPGADRKPRFTDTSITFSGLPVCRCRIRLGQFKFPGAEEALRAIHTFDYVSFTNATDQLLLERFPEPQKSVGAFRDIGVQLFNFFPRDHWEHSYALMIGNGNGLNSRDNNDEQDYYVYWASEYVYGGQGPRRQGWKWFAWYHDGIRTFIDPQDPQQNEHGRTRWGVGTTYRRDNLRFAVETIFADGMIFNGTDGGAVVGRFSNDNTQIAGFNFIADEKARGWYIDNGWEATSKQTFNVRYDRLDRATRNKSQTRRFETWTLGWQYQLKSNTRFILNYEFREAQAPHLPTFAAPNIILDGMDNRFAVQLFHIWN